MASTVAQATDLAVNYFKDLGLGFSATSSVIVAGNKKLLRKVVKMSRAMRLKGVRSAKLLGVGFAGGRRRTAAVSKKRLKDFKDKRGRIQHIRSCGLNPFEYVRTAGLPTITYGFDTN